MVTHLHDIDGPMADLSGLVQSLLPLARHRLALTVTVREIERAARIIYETAGPLPPKAADVVADLSDVLLSVEELLSDSPWPVRRMLIRSAVYMAKAAQIMRGADPSSVPDLEPWWRSALEAYSGLFRLG